MLVPGVALRLGVEHVHWLKLSDRAQFSIVTLALVAVGVVKRVVLCALDPLPHACGVRQNEFLKVLVLFVSSLQTRAVGDPVCFSVSQH